MTLAVARKWLALATIVGALLGSIVADSAVEASHRAQWKVYPVVFYGNNQGYDNNWNSVAERMLQQVRAWYKEQLGSETFELGTTVVKRGQHSWQYYQVDPWARVLAELGSSGEHIWGQGYLYVVFLAFNEFGAGGAGGWNSGAAMLGWSFWDFDQKPEDCPPDWNCPFHTGLGAIAHELGHALNIDSHMSCPSEGTSLNYFWYYPAVVLCSTQKSQLLGSSPFIVPPSGTVPSAPASLSITSLSNGVVQACFNDNSTNEEYFYNWFEQWNGGGGNQWVTLNRFPAYSGTGSRCVNDYAWFSTNDGDGSYYHAKVWAQGSGGNSSRAESSPFWLWQNRPPRPNYPSSPSAYGYNEGYTGLWACWYDRSSDETGFLLAQWDTDLQRREQFFWRGPNSGTPSNPVWTCLWTDVAHAGNYRFDIWAVKRGASSTYNPSAPTKASACHRPATRYAVPTATN